MALGKRLARAGMGALGICAVAIAAATAASAITSRTMSLASAHPWVVTVGDASRTLYPGLDATVHYKVQNDDARPKLLHGTTVEIRNDGVGIYDTNTQQYVHGCLANWFRAANNTIPEGAEVAPGASVAGTVGVVFDKAAASTAACENIGLEIIVTAE
jgi:hypothetical protein